MSKVELVKLSNKEYRGLDVPSYSLLKRLDEFGPRNFTKSFKVEGDAIDFGSYVDCIMFTPEVAEEEFYFEAIEKPTAQLLELANAAYERLVESLVEIKTVEAEEVILDLVKELNLFGSIKDESKIIAKFDTDLFWNYIQTKIDSIGKTVLSISIKSEAEEALLIIKSHEKTKDIFYLSGDEEGINQMQLTGSIRGVLTKVMLDRVVINHKTKTIAAYDLKCTDMRQVNFPYWFIKMKYYLQASLYNAMLTMWAAENYPEYTVEQFRFIVYSRSDKFPFIWKVSDSMLENGLFGYTDAKGMYHKGIEQLTKEYKYYKDTNNFSIEMEFIENSELELL